MNTRFILREFELFDEVTLGIIGGKWRGLVLYHPLDETGRFVKLKRMFPDLERNGVVHREIPSTVEYS